MKKRILTIFLVVISFYQIPIMSMATMNDYYASLGVKQDATEEEIIKAYKRLALQWHPDTVSQRLLPELNKGNISQEEFNQKINQAKEKFQQIGQAYDILKDPVKRKAYDAEQKAKGAPPPTPTPPPAPTAPGQDKAVADANDLIAQANKISQAARKMLKQAIEKLYPFAPATSSKIINISNTRIEKLIKAAQANIAQKKFRAAASLYQAARIWIKEAKADQVQLSKQASGLPKFDAASKKLESLAVSEADRLVKRAQQFRPSPQAIELTKMAINILRPFAPATSAKIISIYNERIQYLMNKGLGAPAKEWLLGSKVKPSALKEQAQLAKDASGQSEFDTASQTLQGLKAQLGGRKGRGR